MADRYVVTNQYYAEDITAGLDISGRKTSDSAFTCSGAGTFKLHVSGGVTGTVSGTNIQGGPVTLVEGENIITTTGVVADGNIDITIAGSTNVNWSNTAIWSDTSGGKCGYSKPSSTNNVYPDANACPTVSTTVSVNEWAYCLSMDWTGATNSPTFSMPSNQLNLYGSLTWVSGVNVLCYGPIWLVGTGSYTITTAGQQNWSFRTGSSGTWTLQSNIYCSAVGQIVCNQGTLNTNGYTVTSELAISIAGAGVKTLTLGASTVNCVGWNYSGSNLTVTANTSTINITGTGQFAGGLIAAYNNINLNGTAHTVSGAFTCANLSRTGTAANTNTVTFTSGTTVTVTGTLTLAGNSRANQLLCQSSTLGTAATISAAIVIVSNTDFMDITGAGAGSWNFSAQTDIGNCGGITGITFPAAVAQTWDNTTGSASNAAKWTSRVPLVGIDDVTIPTTGITFTWDMPRMGKSITFSGTGTITQSQACSIYGSLALASGTYTHNSNAVYPRGRSNYTLTTGGLAIYYLSIRAPGGVYTLQDAYTSSSGYVDAVAGELDFNDQNATILRLEYNDTARARSVKLGNGTLTLVDTGNCIYAAAGNLTFDAEGSTIVISGSNATARSFIGGNLTYNNVTVQGTGNYALTITGNNTFNTFTVDTAAAAKTCTGTAGSIQTVSNFVHLGTNTLTINSTGGAWTLVVTGTRRIGVDAVNMTNCVASVLGKFYAGLNSIDGGGNTNWVFASVPRFDGDSLISSAEAVGVC